MREEATLYEVRDKLFKRIPIVVLLVASIVIFYSLITKVKVSIVLKLKTSYLVIIAVLILGIIFLNGLKLYLVASSVGVTDKIGGVLTRGASQLAAIVTPGTAGAYVIKAYWIKCNGGDWSSGLGVAIVDSFFDAVIVNTIVFLFSFVKFIQGEIVFLPLALYTISNLVNTLIPFFFAIKSSLREYLVSIIQKFRIKVSEKNIENFGKVLIETTKKPAKLIAVIAIALTSLIVQSLVLTLIAKGLATKLTLTTGIIFVSLASLMGGTPVPAGAGLTELTASLITKPWIVLAWRIINFTITLLYYTFFFQLYTIRYIRGKNNY